MAHNCKENTSSIWKLIVFHQSCGKSIQNITKLVNLSHFIVQHMIKHFKEENRIENKVRKGRPRMLTKRHERFIIRKFVKNPRLSAAKASADFNEKFPTSISLETVRRFLREDGLHGRSVNKKIFVSAKNRKLRVSFAKSMINKPKTYWNNFLFSDKCKFNIFYSDGRITVWRR